MLCSLSRGRKLQRQPLSISGFILQTLCRIRLLGVPPWRFALGWQNRSMSGPLLMLVYMISQGAVAGNGPPVLLVAA